MVPWGWKNIKFHVSQTFCGIELNIAPMHGKHTRVDFACWNPNQRSDIWIKVYRYESSEMIPHDHSFSSSVKLPSAICWRQWMAEPFESEYDVISLDFIIDIRFFDICFVFFLLQWVEGREFECSHLTSFAGQHRVVNRNEANGSIECLDLFHNNSIEGGAPFATFILLSVFSILVF